MKNSHVIALLLFYSIPISIPPPCDTIKYLTKIKAANKKVAIEANLDNEEAIQKICKVRAGKEVTSAESFQFFIISKGRASNVPLMQQLFKKDGPQPIWLVGEGETIDYEKAGAKCVVEVTRINRRIYFQCSYFCIKSMFVECFY